MIAIPVAAPMKLPIFYAQDYDLNLGPHIFPSQKYRLTYQQLLESGHFTAEDFIRPQEATDEQLLLVHNKEYLRKVRTGDFTLQELMRLEIRFSTELAKACLLSAGGTIQACELALHRRMAVNLGGGFHHAHAAHGEGFCVLNDVAAGIACCLASGKIRSAMVLDCDVHQGNGTASIFRQESRVYTVSLHQENNYPIPKERSSLDIGLEDGAGDEEYLVQLESAMGKAFRLHSADLMVYVAGADPYVEDQLGGLHLSIAGLKKRDELVFNRAAARNCPVVVTLAGGYARNVTDTVSIHINTILAAKAQHEKL
jgi:acetoin utilization deacetylase AcuC-like enzyme